MITLPANLAALTKLASDDAGRYQTSHVRVESIGTGYTVTSTNCRAAIRVTGPSASDCDALEKALENSPNSGKSGLIPRDIWDAAFAGARKRGAKRLPIVGVQLGPTIAALATSDEQGTAPSVTTVADSTGRYPRVEEVIADARDNPLPIRVRVDPKLMIDLLTVMASVCPGSWVDITLQPEGDGSSIGCVERPILVECADADTGQRVEGVISPIRR